MLSKNLENSTSYDIFFYKFWKKARVYYTLSISRGGGGGPGPRAPPPLDSPLHNAKVYALISSHCEHSRGHGRLQWGVEARLGARPLRKIRFWLTCI